LRWVIHASLADFDDLPRDHRVAARRVYLNLTAHDGRGALARRRFLEVQGHTDQASLDAWRRLAFPLYTRTPRDPDMAHRAVSRSEVLHWFTKPGGESHTFNMFSDLGRIECPTLVLGGEDDPIHPIESQADIAAALPPHLVRFERFPNCGHAVIPDAPERAMAVIRDFMQH
jgi:pimeloyl-ACP methyl ester carboxylesterase